MIPQAVRDATILVVDDEPVNLKLLEALLGGAGYTSVTSTTDPRRVLELYHRLAPDLVMLDLRMPYLDGFAVMRQLRQAQPQGAYLPILMLTAEVATESKQRALSEGATDFLHKPFDPVEVLLRIANLLETRRLHAELRLHNDLLEQRIRERTAEIERARADIAQIAHAAAHDLVEPVRTVAVNAQLLAQHSGQALDGDAARCVDYVVEGSTRSYELLGDLLDYAQAASDTRADVPVDCRAIVERVVQQHAWRIAQSNATVTVESLPTVPGDPTHLAQIFHHLLDNAIKFHQGPGAHVRVWAERGGGQWRFSVADDGIGIEPEHRQRIFALFTRLRPREDYGGNGTGLGISRRLVEDHGGRIWVDPNPDGGSIFRFTVPDTTPTTPPTPGPQEPAVTAGRAGSVTTRQGVAAPRHLTRR